MDQLVASDMSTLMPGAEQVEAKESHADDVSNK